MEKNLDYFIKGYEANEKSIIILSKDFEEYAKNQQKIIENLMIKTRQVKSLTQKQKILETISKLQQELKSQTDRNSIQIESLLKENDEFCENIKKITGKTTCK